MKLARYGRRMREDLAAQLSPAIRLQLAGLLACIVASSLCIGAAPLFLADLIDSHRSYFGQHSAEMLIAMYVTARFSGLLLVDLRWLVVNPFLYRISYGFSALMASHIGREAGYSVRVKDRPDIVAKRMAIVSKMQTGSMAAIHSVLGSFVPALADVAVVTITLAIVAHRGTSYLFPLAFAVFLFAVLFLRPAEVRRSVTAHQADNDVYATYDGMISGTKLIREYRAQTFFRQQLKESIDMSLAAHGRLFRIKWLRGSVNTLLHASVYLLVLAVAIGINGDGELAAGEIFLLAACLDRLIQPLGSLSGAMNAFQGGLTAMIAGYDLLDELQAMRAEPLPEHASWTVRLTDAEPSYVDIQRCRASLRRGDRILITGRSGSGKTTSLAGIYAALRPPISPYTVLYVPAHPEIVRGSVQDNILLGRQGLDMRVIADNLDLWRQHNARAIALDEDASQLSLGERQFICLLRAVLEKPDILILDEALNSIDVRSEQRVCKYIDVLLPSAVLLIVSHREFTAILPNLTINYDPLHRSSQI